MKIACPQCGQHYEVEAGALDRYFRCTECQMLFRGLNAKPVKERRFKRKNKAVDEKTPEAAVAEEVAEIDPAAATAAIAVENMEKESVEAEAGFWEKSLEEDVLAEKAVRYGRYKISSQSVVQIVCVVLMAVALIMAMISKTRVDKLLADHKKIDDKEAVYKERVEKLEQRLDAVQTALQNAAASEEKMKKLFDHINTKVNDQTLARRVDELAKAWEKHYKNSEELKKSVAEFRENQVRVSDTEAAAKQRKSRR